jgi:hypothetical protein
MKKRKKLIIRCLERKKDEKKKKKKKINYLRGMLDYVIILQTVSLNRNFIVLNYLF